VRIIEIITISAIIISDILSSDKNGLIVLKTRISAMFFFVEKKVYDLAELLGENYYFFCMQTLSQVSQPDNHVLTQNKLF
jgi:hypothetical protein